MAVDDAKADEFNISMALNANRNLLWIRFNFSLPPLSIIVRIKEDPRMERLPENLDVHMMPIHSSVEYQSSIVMVSDAIGRSR